MGTTKKDAKWKISKICSDKNGQWIAIGTRKQWLEIRITPSGIIRVGDIINDEHYYFTVKEDE